MSVKSAPAVPIGTVISDQETPTFETVRIKLKAGQDVKPGTLVRIPVSRTEKSALIGRIRSAYEHNPYETPAKIAVNESMRLPRVYPGEEDSTDIFRLAEADLIEEITATEIRSPQSLPNSGSEVFIADENEIVRVLGIEKNKSQGLYIGETVGGTKTDIVLKRESIEEYEEFVEKANPDWYPIPQDFIPTPKMTPDEQKRCFKRTMQMNLAYQKGLYIPVIHISDFLRKYVIQLKKNPILLAKPCIALGGIVPNLLRASKAMPPKKVLENLQHFRQEFKDQKIHVFGIGGTATLHLAALLGINSVDSCGWRNRAARGMIQLPGTGERIVANLGNWRGRKVSQEEEKRLRECPCPACKKYGLYGLKASGIEGFSNRATHNLWILLEETRLIEENLISLGTYKDWYKGHLDNSTYRPLIDQLVEMSLLED